ncbi:MAG: PHP domain-containing protein [Deltaproteobacteria bacterium]|nr:PHP domain-containing protein [Deltaproteobacteria bacterium]MBW2672912.1 PHP domain-containing protein [Deltaproteobacteria bacterium]
MKIDLHIHSKDGSDGRWTLEEIFAEASRREIDVMSIADHDAIHCQDKAIALADRYGIAYIPGVELSVAFAHPVFKDGKSVELHLLGYEYDIHNESLTSKLLEMRNFREKRAKKILENINREFQKEGRRAFTDQDMEEIQASVDGAFGRPHIANYLIAQGIVRDKREAFSKYLVKCDMPKMSLGLEEASELIRGAGGRLVIAHPNDPNGSSLVSLTPSVAQQHTIIRETMLEHIDGVECWHSRHSESTIEAYRAFAREEGLIVTGGSDCHQQPVMMGTIEIPDYVAGQFDLQAHVSKR